QPPGNAAQPHALRPAHACAARPHPGRGKPARSARLTPAYAGATHPQLLRNPSRSCVMGALSPLIMMGLMFVVFYFLLIRPQVKKQREHQEMLNKLGTGEHVITRGGIIG